MTSKKILSILLVVLLCLSTMMVSSAINTSADIEPLTAYRFETANYDASMASNDPTSVKASNDGSVRIKSDHIQQQYQMFFKVTDQKAMKEAIEETCDYYDGFLSIDVAVNQALTISGSACRPSISIDLMDKPHGTKIASTGENSLYSEQAGQFILDVSRFMDEEYDDQIQWVYLQVQCYNWGCGGGYGTQPDITFYPIKVFSGDMDEELPTIATRAPDPNQTTFLNFSPKAKNDDQNDAETIHYSGDGITWRSGAFAKEENYGYLRLTQSLNSREQVQTSYRFDQMGDAAADALNLARMGSNLMKLDITLQECKNEQGQPTIAEIGIGFLVEKGNQPSKPSVTHIRAWQYPGTTRTYYLDVSDIKHISQITNITIFAQNYWYYRAGTKEMFDWNVESGYAGREAAEAAGHVKCQIKPVMIISPISVYKGDRESVSNTSYDLVLDDFNKNGGVVPENITLDDPNIGVFGDNNDDNNNPTSGNNNNNNTTVKTTAKNPVVTTVKPTSKQCAHKYTWVVTKKATYYAKGTEVFRCKYCKKVSKTESLAKKKLGVPKVTIKTSGKKIKIVYKKVKDATGFQVRYKKSGKWKTQKFKTKKNATKYTKKLAKGKYKVQVRSYVTKGKNTAYSSWTKAKTVKIK